jgi:hypothetical protein
MSESLSDACPSCGAIPGEFHELFCNRELCPFCRDFITTCECIFEVLRLSENERIVVEEFIDDSTEPLKTICERWRLEVLKKGRVPY